MRLFLARAILVLFSFFFGCCYRFIVLYILQTTCAACVLLWRLEADK
jgi:hypothetical protein